jgi:hypothetical protein
MEIKMKFECSGVVMGNLWGGGMGYYPSIKFKRDTLDELMVLRLLILKVKILLILKII